MRLKLVLVILLFASVSVSAREVFGPFSKNLMLGGTENGLTLWQEGEKPRQVLTGARVKKILPVPYGVFLLTDAGIVFSGDLKHFEARNSGLIVKTIKLYSGGVKSFSNVIQDLKDLEADPANASNLAACSKDGVYYSTNAGVSWVKFPSPSGVPGARSVAIVSVPRLTLFVGHPFKGLYTREVGRDTTWKDMSSGLLVYGKANEEVSDLYVELEGQSYNLYAAHNFFPSVYKYSRASRRWERVYQSAGGFDLLENLSAANGNFFFLNRDGYYRWENGKKNRIDLESNLNGFVRESGENPEALAYYKNGEWVYNLSELWTLLPPKRDEYTLRAEGKHGVYVAAHILKKKARLNALLSLMEESRLNMMVIDMKDDWGHIRFKPNTPLLKVMASPAGVIDLESFTPEMKKKGIYLVARLVLFQDQVVYRYNNNAYAVKNSSGGPWQGYKTQTNGTRKDIQEFWVDPYSEKVWEYNVAIAKELIERGFDEIQFDYVRFPTDGDNLGKTVFNWRDDGMDKESALQSFLLYARQNIKAPISIDIYGANGWYRTGARTGQDVELFRNFVNAVCPMYYPSHFEPSFMLYPPESLRTYRIYNYGSYRNYAIGRGKIVVRPYVQAFKMNMGYDRKYYGPEYIANELAGIRDSIDQGFTFWNMAVQYQMVPKAMEMLSNRPAGEAESLELGQR